MDLLLANCAVLDVRGNLADIDVKAVDLDTRSVVPGTLYCCLPGRNADGHDFAASAVANGAVGLLVERFLPLAIPQARVAPGTARQEMARVACAISGYPADALHMVGVTGTNGKTTVTQILGKILDTHGWPTEVIGTLDGARTTPEAPALQRRLAAARGAGCLAAALEVSSHALTQCRVDGIRFAAAVFTNLGHDHLDEHHSLEEYFAAKASLFDATRSEQAVINTGDPWGRRLAETVRIPVVPFAVSADVRDVTLRPGHTEFTWRGHRVLTALTGGFNVVNSLAAATSAVALGVTPDTVVEGLARCHPVPGRFELVDLGDAPFSAVVDYAHTPDGLSVALEAARALAGTHRVLCVFGCGGDRDREKRPLMGRVAAAGADLVILTADNSRSEDPAVIAAATRAGMQGPAEVIVDLDRRSALEQAVGLARAGDVVLVAGKGHETTMEVGGVVTPFDDRREVAAAVRRTLGVSSRVTRGERG
jgi:UDP-N-acetylmuramoyl-L-alanyl-D-glutamate--2,6-diaminopimelate ligase